METKQKAKKKHDKMKAQNKMIEIIDILVITVNINELIMPAKRHSDK